MSQPNPNSILLVPSPAEINPPDLVENTYNEVQVVDKAILDTVSKQRMEDYLVDRASLLTVVMLVDSRVATDQDSQTLAWLRSIHRNPLIVATKVDKLKPGERVRTLKQTHRVLGLAEGEMLIPYSSITGDGRDQVWRAIRDVAGSLRTDLA